MDTRIQSMSTSSSKTAETIGTPSPNKGKLLVLGGTGFLGQTICRRAILEGYSVTSLSRRGLPPSVSSSTTTNSGISVSPTNGGSTSSTSSSKTNSIDYRKGDARTKEAITNILNEGGYVGELSSSDFFLFRGEGTRELVVHSNDDYTLHLTYLCIHS